MRWRPSRGTLLLLFVLYTGRAARADTLEKFLRGQGIPTASFSPQELSAEVGGAAGSDERRVVVAYGEVDRLTGKALIGPRWIVRFDKSSRDVQRKHLPAEETASCGSVAEEVGFVDSLILVQTSINPSAGCTLVIDENLALQKTLYGFRPVIVAPHLIALIEDMIHFAPVHPERLQLVDLTKWTISELYPPRGDRMRKRLAAKSAANMPSEDACSANNESCDPKDFDETIDALTADGHGLFAFIVTQEASHARGPGEARETTALQQVLYIYKQQGSGWRYCQQELQPSESDDVKHQLETSFDKVIRRCLPTTIVFPDLGSQKYNPFIH